MANRLKMAKIKAILTLAQHGWSCRRIGRELGIRHETVSKYIHEAGASKPAKAPTGSEPAEPDAEKGSQSDCEPFRQRIQTMLDLGLSAMRIWQDLSDEEPEFQASYWSVRRFVRGLTSTRPLPFRRLESAPGQEAQVDFGTGAPVRQEDGRRRRTHVFRIVLSHSRKAYSEVVYRQTTENFIRCLENAFRHFGGCPEVLVIDNLRAAVKKADWFDPELNPKIEAFCEHYGVAILPTRPYTPRHKGKVEKAVDYVQSNALKGRVFDHLDEQNRHLLDWEASIADTRIHGTTRQQVGRVFREIEKPCLKPLPPELFPFFHESQRTVHRDGHVEVDKSYYSVPPEHVGLLVWVRWDTRLVRVFNHRMERIAIHVKQESGRFSTQPKHIASEKIAGVERGMAWWLAKACLVGPKTAGWAKAMVKARGIQGLRPLMGLMQLADKHEASELEKACETAHSYGAYRLRTVRQLLRRDAAKQQQFDFIEEHPVIRKLETYGQIVRDSFRKGEGDYDRWQETAGA